MAGTRFRCGFVEFERELLELGRWTQPLLDPASRKRLSSFRDDVVAFRDSKRVEHVLRVESEASWATIPTRAWERSRKGAERIGTLSFHMTLHKVMEGKVARCFELGDDTAYHASIEDPKTGERAAWHFDLASSDGIGAVCHTQFVDPLPRLPSLVILPTDALEYLLAELFHADWDGIAARQGYREFHPTQRTRVKAFVGWQLGQLETSGSAWAVLRRARFGTSLDCTNVR